ncbi:MAG: hypothetical protein AB7I18_00670 [Candidatus Berkiella sp.]
MLRTLTVAAFLLGLSPPLKAEIVVIANKNLSVTSLSRDDIYRIYLGKTKFLPNGTKVIPVDQKQGSRSRHQFYSNIIHKTETEIKKYWSQVIFTGQGNPPLQQDDDSAVKNLVAEDVNCLGYIDKSLVDSSVKIIYMSTLAMNAVMKKGESW